MNKKGEKCEKKGLVRIKNNVAINQVVVKNNRKKAKKSFVGKKKYVLLHSQNDGTVTLKTERVRGR